MNIYLIIFIIIIPITIFIFTIINDNQFKIRFNNFKKDIYDIKNTNILTKNVLTLNNGIGFGFGKEFFQCSNDSAVLTDKQKCDLKDKSIGIKFHKFKMNKNYNIPELDNVNLNDYCSSSFLNKNFVNVINNLWNSSDLNFYLSEIIEEDEVNNLTIYYNYSPEDEAIFPNCKEIIEYQQNLLQFDDFFDEENVNNLASASPTTAATETLFDRFSLRSPPNTNIQTKPPLPNEYTKINDDEKVAMATNDIYILKRLLGKDGSLNNEERKRVIRNIFFRATDETKYLEDNDIHIYLVPFIKDDIGIILEGRNGRPLLVMSMYYLKCNKVERIIENVATEKTCGFWITKMVSNLKQLKMYEDDYNKIAKIPIQKHNNRCGARILESGNDILNNYNNLIEEQNTYIQKINKYKNDNDYIHSLIKKNNKNINLLKDLYEYDYLNNHEVKQLSKYKGRSGPMKVIENGVEKEKIVGYNTMVTYLIDRIKEENQVKINKLKYEIDADTLKINKYNNKLKELNLPLENVQSKIKDIIEPHKGTRNIEILQKIKNNILKKQEEISIPLDYAEKIRSLLNFNILIVQMFAVHVDSNIYLNNLLNYNKNIPICDILLKPLNEGGTIINKELKNEIKNKRMNNLFLKLELNLSGIRNIIYGPQSKNTLFDNDQCNKCEIFSEGSNKKALCEKSKYFETAQLNALDLNAQYYLVCSLLHNIETNNIGIRQDKIDKLKQFKKELEFKCLDCQGDDLSNYKVEPNYLKKMSFDFNIDDKSNIKNGFFTNNEAIDNYKWLSRFIVENQLTLNDRFIFEGVEYLQNNSQVFDENLKNTYFQPPTVIQDAIPCDIPDISPFIEVDNTLLNDYILKKQNCKSDYLSRKDSYL